MSLRIIDARKFSSANVFFIVQSVLVVTKGPQGGDLKSKGVPDHLCRN